MTGTRTPDVVETIPLLLQESTDGGGPFNEDGTVNVVLIRPGQARGRGKRVYPRELLESQHSFFKGLPMFDNHESPAIKKLRGGLPRPTGDLRGEIRETSWDPDFETPQDTELGHEKGAVIGRAMPTREMRELIEAVPNAVKLSVRTFATGVRRANYRGKPSELVEGFDGADESSVDFVTRAGAGGHVLALAEADYDREHGDAERTLSGLGDDDLVFHLREHRPHLLEAAAPPEPPEPEPLVTDDAKPITLEEALASTEFATAIDTIVETKVKAQTAEIRESLETEIRSESRRQVEIRDLHAEAKRVISESKLPPTFQDDLNLRYRLSIEESGEARPSAALDVVAERDGEGAVTKPALKVLQEALDADIARERLKLAEAQPTRVRGQGAATTGDGGTPPAHGTRSRGRASFATGLRSAGVDTKRLTGEPAPARGGAE